MPFNSDYVALKHLLNEHGYKLLEAHWMLRMAKIEEARDKAAYRGSETAWRYYAGQEKGFKLAMTTIQQVLTAMEAEAEHEQDAVKEEGKTYEEILQGIKGEKSQ